MSTNVSGRHRSPARSRVGIVCWLLMAVTSLSLPACGGSVSNPVAPSTQPAQSLIVYEPGDGVTLPTLVREVKPSYTAQALAARIQGAVLLSAVVLSNGVVGEVTVVRSLDTQYGLDSQAVRATKQWLFDPGTKDGLPVAVRVTIEMSFTIT